MIELMNAEVLAISKRRNLFRPTADIIDSIVYGNHTQNVAKNIIQPVCIDFFLAATRCLVNSAYGPHTFCAFIEIFRSSCEMAA